MFELKKATRQQVKIRMSLASPTGFGKTMGALMIAYGITKDWDKIAVIDTENGSASLYANHKVKNGFVIGEFNTIPLPPPFTPERYTEAIKVCENAGMEVIIIDSITHVWKGQGGLIESNNQLGGSFQSWAKTTPRYQKWLDSILQSKCHIITTNRKKQAYNIVQENGKTKVEKRGMDDEIRDGYDYEMTIAFEIANENHLVYASKDRTGIFADQPEFTITPETGRLIKEWCESGAEPEPMPAPTPVVEVEDYNKKLESAATKDALTEIYKSIPKDQRDEYKSSIPVKLAGCKNEDDLGAMYKALSKEDQKKFKALVTDLKKSLTPKQEEAA